ncbi:Hsp33 family molecular chaperone HslO [Acetomicrobium sp.]|uniref:Hsp33 family molecular chaperone HslO n=1 Tax=Acetomicrobium sp. TaxID=1872099 RepID=UPI001BD18598|nr:Hsp33 family molecular chaperone HslO [Acetomicrobium sp.]
MPESDAGKAVLHKCLLGKGDARAIAVEATGLVELLRQIHNLSFVATAALGRLVMASMMMAAQEKGERARVTLKIEGDGPLGEIVADAERAGSVRGYVSKPWVELPLSEEGKWDVSAGVGKRGYLTVIKDVGLREPVVSRVPLISGEIAEDIAYYYVKSEQMPTAVMLGVLQRPSLGVISAGGVMVQLMPGADEAFAEMLEELLKRHGSVSRLAESSQSPRDILETIFDGVDKKWLDSLTFEFGCRCSRKLAEALLLSTSEGEEANDVIEVRCHFCNTVYSFSRDEIKKLKGGE